MPRAKHVANFSITLDKTQSNLLSFGSYHLHSQSIFTEYTFTNTLMQNAKSYTYHNKSP